MISYKSRREIELMRESGMMLSKTRKELEKHIKPGISTYQLDLIAEEYILSLGGKPNFKGYEGFPGTMCTSINEEVVHGIPKKDRILKDGDIITLDLGVVYKGYHSDSAWTYAVGKVDRETLKLMEVTKGSLMAGIKAAVSGNRVSDISGAIEDYIKPYGYGIVEDLTGHGIGRELHEDPIVPNFRTGKKGALLSPGMTICIEPMVNAGTKEVKLLDDGWTFVTKDHKMSAHYELMIVITENGNEILTPYLE